MWAPHSSKCNVATFTDGLDGTKNDVIIVVFFHEESLFVVKASGSEGGGHAVFVKCDSDDGEMIGLQ